MLDVFCPGHGCVVLLAADGIEALRHVSGGIEVSWRCACGERGLLRLGRQRLHIVEAGPSAERQGRVEGRQQDREGVAVEHTALG